MFNRGDGRYSSRGYEQVGDDQRDDGAQPSPRRPPGFGMGIPSSPAARMQRGPPPGERGPPPGDYNRGPPPQDYGRGPPPQDYRQDYRQEPPPRQDFRQEPPRQGFRNEPPQDFGRQPPGGFRQEPPQDNRRQDFRGSRQSRDPEKFPPSPPVKLRPIKNPGGQYFIFGNLAAISPTDFPNVPEGDIYILIDGEYVFSAQLCQACPPGQIGLTDPQRTWCNTGIGPSDSVMVQLHDPLSGGANIGLHRMDILVDFAGKKTTSEYYDQDQLADTFKKTYARQMFLPGQYVVMDFKNIPLKMTINDTSLIAVPDGEEGDKVKKKKPAEPGIVATGTTIMFQKHPSATINIKASARKAVTTSIMQQGFKFEDLGIGGLDKQFAIIFRRAFASRMFPAALAEKMGLTHVRGILLYGPPGTGKTLIARKIGDTLNAREPKVVNGPEILNKYVGQSEENIRKLFADAEVEQKEKGTESGLHVIIFDEIDAICKQRGSGGGGGTGVGDSIVNQLLSKLDGVNQLNNILVIGMTNRMDMIDDALLRPGRLELHIEIHLPDEDGREQILGIHTKKMSDGGYLDEDVNLREIASLTVNFSGAELAGLVRAAQSFAMQRHYEIGESIKLKDDWADIQVRMEDMVSAVDEITPAYGAKLDALTKYIQGDILPFSPNIKTILKDANRLVADVRDSKTASLKSIILHGPPRSGKTALAAKIAIDSKFPFIRIISRRDMMSLPESVRVSRITDVFQEAYKSNLSMIFIDSLELLVDYVSLGPRFNTPNLTALLGSVKEPPPSDHRLVVIATSSQWGGIGDLGFKDAFQYDIEVPPVESMEELQRLVELAKILPEQVAYSAFAKVASYVGDEINVGVARLLEGMRVSLTAEDPALYFADDLRKAMRQRPSRGAQRRMLEEREQAY